MAIRLSKAFGSRPEIWLKMQLAFDLAAAGEDRPAASRSEGSSQSSQSIVSFPIAGIDSMQYPNSSHSGLSRRFWHNMLCVAERNLLYFQLSAFGVVTAQYCYFTMSW